MNHFLSLVLAIDVVGYTVDMNWNQYWRKDYNWSDGFFRLVNIRSGKCLDVPDDKVSQNDVNIRQWDCLHQSENQQWKWDDGQLQNKKSGKCITVPNGDPQNGKLLTQQDCSGTKNQQWEDFRGALINSYSRICLDLPADDTNKTGAHIQQWDCTARLRFH